MTPGERTRAILVSRADTSIKVVLLAIADAMHEDRLTSWLSVETIANRASLCERQARAVLREAEQLGVLHRWKGEHAQRNCEIRWDVLAALTTVPSKRGGSRKQAKTAGHHANTATPPEEDSGTGETQQSAETMQTLPPVEGGSVCQGNMQSLPGKVANTATESGKHCPLSGSEADLEADLETVRAPSAPPPRTPPAQVELIPRPAAAHPKPSSDTPFLRRVTDQFGEAFLEVFHTDYPWVFKGREHDGHRRNIWIEAAKIREADPEPGLQRLRVAALAYCRAVKDKTAWPKDEPANTARFTDKIATWLQPADGALRGQDVPRTRPLTMQERAALRRDRPVVVDASPLRLESP